MKKNLFTMFVLLAWTTSLFAQITRVQADAIVLDFLKNEVTDSGFLYVHANAPSEEGIVITTSNEEAVKAKYACWVYYLNESELSKSRYLFVKEDNGSLLEIIANNDTGPDDFSSWEVVDIAAGTIVVGNAMKHPYPNPVNDLLTIPCNGDNVRVKIYDLTGTCLYSGLLKGKDDCRLNVSFLNAGVYILSVDGEAYRIIKK
jgi:hypothetical protein